MGTSETPLPRLIEEAVELVREISEEEGGSHV
jgi:transcription termination factor NusB